jgi:hypothetical protein
MYRAFVLFKNEILSCAAKERIATRVIAADIPSESRILHHIPAVLSIKRTSRGGFTRSYKEITFEKEVLHRAWRIAYAATPFEYAVFNNAVVRCKCAVYT